jgi:hypothetical protein
MPVHIREAGRTRVLHYIGREIIITAYKKITNLFYPIGAVSPKENQRQPKAY